LFEIAVVIATRFGAPAPFHVNGINMSPSRPSMRALQASATPSGKRQMVEQCRAVRVRALNGQEPQFADHPAGRRETAGLAAGGQHTMTGYDQRNWILPEGQSDVALEQLVAETFGDFPISQR